MVVWKLEHSCQISIILFLYPLCLVLLLKKQWSASWLSSLVHVLCLRLWSSRFLKSAFVYQKKENSQLSQGDDRVSHVGYQESTCRSWHQSLFAGSHIVSNFVSIFLALVVYCSYTRPRGCLLSTRLTKNWLRIVTVTVHDRGVTKKASFNFINVH